jgi:Putative prokaryotic signal transducing protein
MANLTLLRTFPDEWEANMMASALEAYGIRSMITGEFTADFRAEAPGVVQLHVPAEDAIRAESVLQELRETAAEQDEEDYGERVFGWQSTWLLQIVKWCVILFLISELVGVLFSIPELFDKGPQQ